MGLINKTLAGIYNGVSQQPSALRLDNQLEEQENMYSDLVYGLMKRPNTAHVSNLTSNADTDALVHRINRDSTEQYIVMFTTDETEPIEIFTLDGTKCTVTYQNITGGTTKDYVLYDDDDELITPRDHIKAVTITDHTIIVNTQITTGGITDTGIVEPNHLGLAWVKLGYPGIKYTIDIKQNGSITGTANYTAPTPPNGSYADSAAIATNLASSLSTALGANWSVNTDSSIMIVESLLDEDFEIVCSDTLSDTAFKALNHYIPDMKDLPPKAVDGYVVEVLGEESNNFSHYYLKYNSITKAWEETSPLRNAEGELICHLIEASKAPHRLIRTGTNTFTLAQCTWERRNAGDCISNPAPSWIDSRINNVFFHRNRLGILSGENVSFSRAGEYFNWFSATVTDVLDSDPIDLSVANTNVSVLYDAVPFGEVLLLFSDQQQFILTTNGALLTPSTVSIDTSTSYEINPQCKPVGSGANVYFTVSKNNHTTVREYYVREDVTINDAANVTAHVPSYIEANINNLRASTINDLILAHTIGSSTIYVYKYHWEGEKKAQSSWSKWTFDDDILGLEIFNNKIYMVTTKGSSIDLVEINLDLSFTLGSLDFRVHLDKLVELTGSYNSGTDTTTWTLPYSDSSTNFDVINSSSGLPLSAFSKASDTTITATGDYSSTSYYIGKIFSSVFVLSKQYFKNQQGISDIQGQLTLNSMTLSFTDSGSFRVGVTPKNRPAVWTDYTAIVTGITALGSPAIIDDEHKFNIMGNGKDTTIQVDSSNYLPLKIQLVAFEANYSTQAKLI